MHEIKNGAPIPKKQRGPARNPVYPFATMKDDDHFDTPIREDETPEKAVKRMRTTSTSYRMRHQSTMAFSVRAVEDEQTGELVIRVWARASVAPVPRDKGNDSFFSAKA
jgi:hypothetical protein